MQEAPGVIPCQLSAHGDMALRTPCSRLSQHMDPFSQGPQKLASPQPVPERVENDGGFGIFL